MAVEARAGKRFKPDFLSGIRSLEEGTALRSSWVVHLGSRELKEGDTWILPVRYFLERLHRGEILGT